jgi:hypothetical protein
MSKKILLSELINEEVEGDKLNIYHFTNKKNAKNIITNNYRFHMGMGRVGRGAYFVYDDPSDISGGMNAYGGITLKYSIPLDELTHFLIFDRELQIMSLHDQLIPDRENIVGYISQFINDENRTRYVLQGLKKVIIALHDKGQSPEEIYNNLLNLYERNKLKQLHFLEFVRDMNILNRFKGIIYSVKGTVSDGGMKITGTHKTLVVYDQDILNFEGVSTDGVTFKRITNDEETPPSTLLKSPETSLKKNLVPPNTTIKKSYVKLNGGRNVTLPRGLKIIGSLDLRKIQNLTIPNDLEVTNSLYVSPGTVIPDGVRAKHINVY